jgi:hypothetical protein
MPVMEFVVDNDSKSGGLLSESCAACGHAYPGRCEQHNPNLSPREKRILDVLIMRLKDKEAYTEAVRYVIENMKRPYTERGTNTKGRTDER